jgi:hypothetical protein
MVELLRERFVFSGILRHFGLPRLISGPGVRHLGRTFHEESGANFGTRALKGLRPRRWLLAVRPPEQSFDDLRQVGLVK